MRLQTVFWLIIHSEYFMRVKNSLKFSTIQLPRAQKYSRAASCFVRGLEIRLYTVASLLHANVHYGDWNYPKPHPQSNTTCSVVYSVVHMLCTLTKDKFILVVSLWRWLTMFETSCSRWTVVDKTCLQLIFNEEGTMVCPIWTQCEKR